MTHYDILIVGAGPAGSRVAYQMSSLGYRVGVLEKNERIGSKLCCTGIIGKECAELFNIDRKCILQRAKSAKLFAPSGEFIRISKNHTQAYIVDRTSFDRSLAQKAQKEGAIYLLSTHVRDLSVSGDGITVYADQQGDTLTFQSKAVVIANGFPSNLSNKLGFGRITNSIAGAQAEVKTRGTDEVEVYFSHRIAPGFFAWLVPISRRKARVGLFAKENPGAHLKELLVELALQGKVFDAEVSISYGVIPLKPLPRTYGNRVLVVGDAAGQVKPTTGGGIYYGLLCADIASETLHQAFSTGNLSKRRLAHYEKRWKEKLGRELKIDYFARRFYNRLSDKKINRIFNVVRDHNIHETLLDSPNMSFDWHSELVLDGLKRLTPWRKLFGQYIPAYIWASLRGRS